jgi:hypothetical protein
VGQGLAPGSLLSTPIYCRRDDYMFLPPNALGGLPCVAVAADEHVDPLALALRMENALPPPALRIGMNPTRGMVNVPTWFWVEGYDGGTLAQAETVLEQHTSCHLVPERGDDGVPLLGSDGRPRTRQACTLESTRFGVQVRLWPQVYVWDFGDQHAQTITCAGRGECGQALGAPFVDPSQPSPIQHPYGWSSLGVNGSADAYTIQLGITFAAEYRVSIDGQDQGGWRRLPSRTLTWSAPHQVQEAQAVLTRPCPVTLAHC